MPYRLPLAPVQQASICIAAGAKVTEETTLPAALLMNLIFLCGLFTFAVVLGFVSEEIKSQLRSVKAGNYAGTSFHHPTRSTTQCFLSTAGMLAECRHPYQTSLIKEVQ